MFRWIIPFSQFRIFYDMVTYCCCVIFCFSLGKGAAVDLSAVASVTSGLSGAELEFIVNEAAIRAVRRVSAQLRDGVDVTQINSTVKPTDYEESIKNFFETRRVSRGGVNMGEVLNNAFRK
jgi:SpoVK/Ycf46/Vps4 family AAA+-type ATPase